MRFYFFSFFAFLWLSVTAHADFFEHRYRFANGNQVLYLPEARDGYAPGLFFMNKGADTAYPLQTDAKHAECSGKLWFMETTEPLDQAHQNLGSVDLMRASGRAKMAFFGVGDRGIAVNEKLEFLELLHFESVLKDHPQLKIQLFTAPETVKDSGQAWRAIELRYSLPISAGQYQVVIERALVNQSFAMTPLPRFQAELKHPIEFTSVPSLGKTWGERGPILTLDHQGHPEQNSAWTRTQIYLSDLKDAAKSAEDFPLSPMESAGAIPVGVHFRPAYAHENFFEFMNRIYGEGSKPKPIHQNLMNQLTDWPTGTSSARPPLYLRTHGDRLTALSFFSYHATLLDFVELPKKTIPNWPVIEYERPVGQLSEAELERYFEELDQLRAFAKQQPLVMLVPDQAPGTYRLHVIHSGNVGRMLDELKPVYSVCDQLAK